MFVEMCCIKLSGTEYGTGFPEEGVQKNKNHQNQNKTRIIFNQPFNISLLILQFDYSLLTQQDGTTAMLGGINKITLKIVAQVENWPIKTVQL